MGSMLFGFVVLSLLGMTMATYRALDGLIDMQNTPLSSTAPVSSSFLAYKAALLTYVTTHPGTTGTVPISLLALDDDQVAALSDAGSEVIKNGSGTTVEAWAAMSTLDILKTITASQGDMSIGQAEGDTWTTPGGGDMGTLPVPVATGHAVSVVTLTGSGF